MRRYGFFSAILMITTCPQPAWAQIGPNPYLSTYPDPYRQKPSPPPPPPSVYDPGPDQGGRTGINIDHATSYNKDGRVLVKALSVPRYFKGLKSGDFIYAVNGIQFSDLSGYSRLAAEHPPGTWITLWYLDSARNYLPAEQTAILQSAWELQPPAPPSPTYATNPFFPVPTLPSAQLRQDNFSARQADLNNKLDRIIQTDSAGWIMNVYRPGSVRNARIVSQSNDGATYIARGDFSYASGASGWVETKISGNQLVCLHYQDTWGGCRGIYDPNRSSEIGAVLVAGLVVAIVALAASGGSDSGYASANGSGGNAPGGDGYSGRRTSAPDWTDRPREPTRPIGGDDGLFGCASPPCWTTGGPP